MAERTSERPERAGFGRCPQCAYVSTGSAGFCFDCAQASMVPPAEDCCQLCEQTLTEREGCGNPLCGRSVEERGWSYIWAIAMRSGALQRTINNYKYDGIEGWAWIFGRILVGYLEEHEFLDEFDVIMPMPTYVGTEPGARTWDHIGKIIDRAAAEGPEWPFRQDVMSKTAPTPKMVGLGFGQRAQMVETKLRPALRVDNPDAVKGKRVLVFDDVFTGGLTLREVAYKLKDAGAMKVAGLVLARQPYGG